MEIDDETKQKEEESNLTLILTLSIDECNFHHTLINGQCFHWTLIAPNEWITPIDEFLCVALQSQNKASIFLVAAPFFSHSRDIANCTRRLHQYFFVKEDQQEFLLTKQYETWKKADPDYFAIAAMKCPGVRLLQQNPFECLISFICSSNNNISRITSMLQSFRKRYGKAIGVYRNEMYYRFPTLKECNAWCKSKDLDESVLRFMGFGYRAKYIMDTLEQLRNKNDDQFLDKLHRSKTQKDSQAILECLQQFQGVGPKVAACVALYSLGCFDVVPQDVHMNRMIATHYGNLQHYQSLFGEFSGWVQSVLFTAKVFDDNKKSKTTKKKRNIENLTNNEIKIENKKTKKQ
jgi:N-glycosylase/DNA lyase